VQQARGRFAVVFLVFGFLLSSAKVAYSQDQSIISSTTVSSTAISSTGDHPTAIPRLCGERWPVPYIQRARLATVEAEHWDKLCAELRFDRNAIASPWHADVREKEDEDAVAEELKAMGERGMIILRAREEVAEILQSQNRCAAWFEQAESDGVRKFRSLRYAIDETGPQYILKIQSADGGWHYEQPYIAGSMENASAGSTITINGRGAFFQLRSGVRIVPTNGGPGGLSTSQLLHIDVYVGGTLPARVVALLHEYSHVVGLLPADGGFGGLSTQNTQIVLRHCRAEVEAVGKHKSMLLPPGVQ
jgi:hypothetical protein